MEFGVMKMSGFFFNSKSFENPKDQEILKFLLKYGAF